jgi:hypothetical protein
MNSADIFNNIQLSILNMEIKDQVSLLNSCLVTLNNFSKQNSTFDNIIKQTLYKNSCVLDKETMKLFDVLIGSFGIEPNNFLIKNIQMGGNPPTPTTLARYEGDSVANKDVIIIDKPPSNLISNIASISQSGFSKKDMFILTQQLIAAETAKYAADTIRAQNEGALVAIQQQNENFVKSLIIGGVTFSFAAPGALLYYLKSSLDTITMSLSFTGKSLSTAVGVTDLSLRNAIPISINSAISAGKLIKDFLPENVLSFLKSSITTLQTTGMSDYAEKSEYAEKIEQATAIGEKASSDLIVLHCIIFYIGLALLLNILSALIIRLYADKKIGFYAAVFGAKTERGGRRTKNHTKRKQRKTRKRHTSKTV